MTVSHWLDWLDTRAGRAVDSGCHLRRRPGRPSETPARTPADFSGGRFILGLGAGWHEPEFEAFGIESDRLSSRLIEYTEALVALLAGGPVDYDGRYVKLRGAEVGGETAPPVMIGATGPRGIDLLSRHAQGWNFGGRPEDFPALLAQVRERESAAGRPPGSVMASASTCAWLGQEDQAAELVARMPPDIGSVLVGADALRATVEKYRAAGCDHLILHLSGVPFTSHAPDQLELTAAALGLGSRSSNASVVAATHILPRDSEGAGRGGFNGIHDASNVIHRSSRRCRARRSHVMFLELLGRDPRRGPEHRGPLHDDSHGIRHTVTDRPVR